MVFLPYDAAEVLKGGVDYETQGADAVMVR